MADGLDLKMGNAGLQRVLGPFDATCIVIGAVIGVGIFFTPSRVAQVAGSSGLALAAWTIGGVIALCGALCFAELGSLYDRSAGQYEILRDAYGPLIGFLFVFCNATAILAGSAAVVAMICASNLSVALTGREPDDTTSLLYSSVMIAGLMLANLLGVVWGSWIQNISVVAKILTLLLVAFIAMSMNKTHEFRFATDGTQSAEAPTIIRGLMTALVPALFAYGGWQQALWIGGEIRDPRRNVPRAVVGGMIIVTAVYLLANWAYLSLLGQEGVATSRALAADAVSQYWPHAGRRFIAAAVALSAFGVMNSQLLTGPRLVYGMASDGRFFSLFARVSPRFKTPYAAILLIGTLAFALLLAAAQYRNGVDRLMTGVVTVDSVFFVLTGIALFVLRRKRPDLPRLVSVPGYPLVPLLFILFEAGVLIGSFLDKDVIQSAMIGGAWVIMAGVCYVMFFRGSAGRNERGVNLH
jgi:APA family basic amino acid/polyamine antiporter